MNKILQFLSLTLIIAGCIILYVFLNKAHTDGYVIKGVTDYTVTGQFGDFVGGVIGTLFTLAGTFLIYLTFNEQKKENKRISFESSYFQMINLHRENISDAKLKVSSDEIFENREVYKQIFFDFIECYREVKKFSNSKEILDYITPKYEIKLKEIKSRINPNIDLIEMAIIDIAYSIVFYGLNTEGISVIRKNFQKKYNTKYYYKLLFYIKLKPSKNENEYYKIWEEARGLELKKLHELVFGLYGIRKRGKSIKLNELGEKFQNNISYQIYYSGYQSILGHYFRHLYQTFKYLNENISPKDKTQYSYAKMLRAQLSTFEQALLMINSISSLGMRWEYTPEITNNHKINSNLITHFNLIKNLPGEHMYGIRYNVFYPKVDFEYKDQF